MDKCIDIFCGAGGLALGLQNAGFKHTAMYDLNEDAIFTANINLSNYATCINIKAQLNDILEIHKNDDIDVIAGGPPCQPFSVGGKGKRHDDERNFFPETIQLIKKIRPKAFIIENVAGLFHSASNQRSYGDFVQLQLKYCDYRGRNTNDWESRLHQLESKFRKSSETSNAYNVQVLKLNAADFGIPQVRKRAFLIGIRSDQNSFLIPPVATHSKNGLNMHRSNITIENFKDTKKNNALKPWVTVRDALSKLPEMKLITDKEYSNHFFIPGARSYPGHTGSVFDQPSKTITAGTHGVGGGQNTLRLEDGNIRYFTLLECQILQSFPIDFHFFGNRSSVLSQIGNAVPPLLAEIVAKTVYAAIR